MKKNKFNQLINSQEEDFFFIESEYSALVMSLSLNQENYKRSSIDGRCYGLERVMLINISLKLGDRDLLTFLSTLLQKT